MKISDSNSSSVQLANPQQPEQLLGGGDWYVRQERQICQHAFSAMDGTKRQLQANKRVSNDFIVQEQIAKFLSDFLRWSIQTEVSTRITLPPASHRRLGLGSLPPRAANLRAASLCTSLVSASLFPDAGVMLGLLYQLIIQCNRRAHGVFSLECRDWHHCDANSSAQS